MSLLRKDFPNPGGVSLTFDPPISLLLDLREAVTLLTEVAADRLRRNRLLTRKITVWLELNERCPGQPQQLYSRVTDLPVPAEDTRLLALFARGAVDELYLPGAEYRAAGIYYEDLALDERVVAGLLDYVAAERSTRAYTAMSRIVRRYGRRAIVRAG
jgi:DNA polymerase V